MAVPGPAPTPRPPQRTLPRLAGALTQLACGTCLLVGTIGLVLVQQNKAGGNAVVALWLAIAMAGLVFGGLIYRGGMVRLIIAAAIDAGFGIALVLIDYDTLRDLLRMLPASDVGTIGDALDLVGCMMLGIAVLCVVALPQGGRYARWFRDAAATRNAMSTARGFPPPPIPARGSAYIIPADIEPASRRRLYIALGGLAVGVGTGVGVLVSSTRPATPVARVATVHAGMQVTPIVVPGDAGSGDPAVVVGVDAAAATQAAVAIDAAAGDVAVVATPGDAAEAASGAVRATGPVDTVQRLVAAQHAAIAKNDMIALTGLLAPVAFGFGIDGDEVAEGRAAIGAQLARDLGAPPAGGFTVESRGLVIGELRSHAWIAEELALVAPDGEPRRIAVSELAAVIDGRWQVVALHWAMPVDDATAEHLALRNALPPPHRITDRHDGPDELDRAVRTAFASRAGFVDARSERADAFNFGSGGERARGGGSIKRLFGKLKAQITQHDGVRVVAGSAWDPAQRSEPWIGYAALNVDFTAGAQAAASIGVTQTFRVLAVLIKEGSDWKLVQTQWSNGGPLR